MTQAGAKDVERAAEGLAAQLPASLGPLARLAFNYRWCWEPGGPELFRAVDPDRFERVRGNPVRLLRESTVEDLQRAAANPELVEQARAMEARLLPRDEPDASRPPVAFFCAEYGIHPSFHIYSGGLGVLAGDILKEASDRALPMVGVGVMYAEGAHQRLDISGWQHDYWVPTEPDLLPAALVTGDDGMPLTVRVGIRDRDVIVQVWRVEVGRVPLFLLDTNRPDNHPLDRWISTRLYVGDRKTRLAKYLVLGVGGIRALHAMGIDPPVIHMNEGHAAFAPLALAAEEVARGRPLEEAMAEARGRTVFTTHTPVAAGNESFSPGEIGSVATELRRELGVTESDLLALGRTRPADPAEGFGITTLGLRLSRAANGVSRRHGAVARGMWHVLYPDRAPENVPIGHITNGVHIPSWMADPMRELLDRHLGEGWSLRADDPATWEPVDDIPDGELWNVRTRLRSTLIDFLRDRATRDRLARGENSDEVAEALESFDPEALTMGFARRVTMYKRLYLLIRDPDRAEKILRGPPPVQVVLAGKAHHQDMEAKHALRSLFILERAPRLADRVAYIQDYDMKIASRLVSGCDVWINLPRPGMEASGTSGMKNALNGGLNLSVLDGWWEEGFDGENGWAVGQDGAPDLETQDHQDSESFYGLLENEVLPLFSERDAEGVPVGWVRKVKASLRSNGWRFGAGRMVREYARDAYGLPV